MTIINLKHSTTSSSSSRGGIQHVTAATSSYQQIRRAVTLILTLALASIVGGLVTARHFAFKTFRHVSLSRTPSSMRKSVLFGFGNISSNSAPSLSRLQRHRRKKNQSKAKELVEQEERSRQVRDENEQLRKLIKILKDAKGDGEEL